MSRTVALGEPLLEATLGRVEVAAKVGVEIRHAVAKLEQAKLEHALRIAGMSIPFLSRD